MNYTDAREYAYFLTDKMAYELNLTPTQYDQVYQVNLDYFLSVNSPYDLYGPYRDYRDDDLRYILYDWQYARYVGVDYFYRPLSWTGSSFIFNVYTRYSYRDRFFFDRPSVYISYRGSDWGYRRPEYRSPYYGLRVVESRYGGLRDSYVARYGDRGYSSYYRNEPLRIVEGRYGGRGWSYDTGNSYYGGGAYSSPRYEGSSYGVPSYNGSYAPSRQYEGGGASGRRGTTYGSGSSTAGILATTMVLPAHTRERVAATPPLDRTTTTRIAPVTPQDAEEVRPLPKVQALLRKTTTQEATLVRAVPLTVPPHNRKVVRLLRLE